MLNIEANIEVHVLVREAGAWAFLLSRFVWKLLHILEGYRLFSMDLGEIHSEVTNK